jgi:phosphonate metabolism protein PhnN/1,5-bisphosphokinase (PRPP-forming)
MLICVVGGSGTGKSYLINCARQAREFQGGCAFPLREITRVVDPKRENHVWVSESDFEKRKSSGLYAFSWSAHGGTKYGIPKAMEADLAENRVVVIDISRACVEDARRLYPDCLIIEVIADRSTREARIRARGGQSEAEIQSRVDKGEARVAGEVETIDNSDGRHEAARAKFLALISDRLGRAQRGEPG